MKFPLRDQAMSSVRDKTNGAIVAPGKTNSIAALQFVRRKNETHRDVRCRRVLHFLSPENFAGMGESK